MEALTESLRMYFIYLGGLWMATLIVTGIMAIFGGKWGAVAGGVLGFVGGHVILLHTPMGIPVVILETVIVVLGITGYIMISTYRSVEVIGVGSSMERGFGWWFRPQPPIYHALRGMGEADQLRLEGQRDVIDAQRQLEGQRHDQFREEAMLRRLLQEGQRDER